MSARIYEVFPPDALECYQATPSTGWVDVKHDRFATKGILEVLGAERAEALWIEFIASYRDTALFRALVQSMIRLFGLTPDSIRREIECVWRWTQ